MTDNNFELVACERDGTITSSCKRTDEINQACEATAQMYERLGFDRPWIGYIAVQSGIAAGGGAFVGAPANNRVEIAYFTCSDHQRMGVAGRTASRLIDIARCHSPGIELYAKTMPQQNASTRILANLGFQMIGSVTDHEIGEAWAWLLR